jgi:hypothetical protein
MPRRVLTWSGKNTPSATSKSFASSPIPNQRMTSGISARCATLLRAQR